MAHALDRTRTLRIAILAFVLALLVAGPAAAYQEPGGWDDPAAAEPAHDDGWGDDGDDDDADDGGDAWDDDDDRSGRDGRSDDDDGGGDDDGDAWEDDSRWGDDGVPVAAAPAPLPEVPQLATVPVTRTTAGTAARLRTDGRAAIPRGAPKRVQGVIAAANQIVGKPYRWGGGHGRLVDSGYDCSGAVSYALIRSALLSGPLVSGQLARWQSAGAGRWVSVYANKGHVYMEVAGLRLDTSPVGDSTRRMGVRWRPVIGRRRGFAARHPAGL